MKHDYLSIGAIFKDEAPYLAEWIEFHRLVGVEHFFLYDNLSTDEKSMLGGAGPTPLAQHPVHSAVARPAVRKRPNHLNDVEQ